MENLIIIVILIIVGYIGWKIVVAMFKGILLAGKSIDNNGAGFFSKVFSSMAAGVISGMVIAFTTGGTMEYAGPGALGITAMVLFKEFTA
jgi:hypothetical protein